MEYSIPSQTAMYVCANQKFACDGYQFAYMHRNVCCAGLSSAIWVHSSAGRAPYHASVFISITWVTHIGAKFLSIIVNSDCTKTKYRILDVPGLTVPMLVTEKWKNHDLVELIELERNILNVQSCVLTMCRILTHITPQDTAWHADSREAYTFMHYEHFEVRILPGLKPHYNCWPGMRITRWMTNFPNKRAPWWCESNSPVFLSCYLAGWHLIWANWRGFQKWSSNTSWSLSFTFGFTFKVNHGCFHLLAWIFGTWAEGWWTEALHWTVLALWGHWFAHLQGELGDMLWIIQQVPSTRNIKLNYEITVNTCCSKLTVNAFSLAVGDTNCQIQQITCKSR